jgi:hypothetical protein
MQRAKPLYRKVNTRTHGVNHGSGQRASYVRGSSKPTSKSMHSGQRHGLDYTPLYRFLLSRVGQSWDEVHSLAVARLDREDPIYHLVARNIADAVPFVRTGESSYFSGLHVVDGILCCVDPTVSYENFKPTCACCTHSFNGQTVELAYEPHDKEQ